MCFKISLEGFSTPEFTLHHPSHMALQVLPSHFLDNISLTDSVEAIGTFEITRYTLQSIMISKVYILVRKMKLFRALQQDTCLVNFPFPGNMHS